MPPWTDINPACTGKHRFDDHGLASRVAKKQRRTRKDEHVAPYRCAACGGWHIGTSTRKPKGKK